MQTAISGVKWFSKIELEKIALSKLYNGDLYVGDIVWLPASYLQFEGCAHFNKKTEINR